MNRSPNAASRSRWGWAVLLFALAIEALGGAALLLSVAGEMLAASDEPLGQRLSIFIAVLLAWLWAFVTLFGSVRSRASWVRGSALTIHVLIFAAGTGALQQGIGSPLLAIGLIVLALFGFFGAIVARPSFDASVEAHAADGKNANGENLDGKKADGENSDAD